jgi:hypothetical protein
MFQRVRIALAWRPWPGALRHIRGRLMVRLIPALFCIVAASIALADEPQDEKARAALSLEHGRAEVAKFKIRAAGPRDDEFRLQPKPVLHWSNQIRGSLYGDVYVWTLKGRPEVVGSFLEYFPSQHTEVELHSLSLRPLVAERPDQLSWTASEPGVRLKPIPGAPPPAKTPAQRLRQIRELAKDFTARQTARDGIDYQMRLLLQPLYRYEGTDGALIDGALFAFVHAGDPEVFLLIEARNVGDTAEWQYALARFNSIFLAVNHKGREIWSVQPIVPWEQVLDRQHPYTAIMLGSRRN